MRGKINCDWLYHSNLAHNFMSTNTINFFLMTDSAKMTRAFSVCSIQPSDPRPKRKTTYPLRSSKNTSVFLASRTPCSPESMHIHCCRQGMSRSDFFLTFPLLCWDDRMFDENSESSFQDAKSSEYLDEGTLAQFRSHCRLPLSRMLKYL